MPLVGKIGEHYEIVSLLGSGAMGEVYRAVDRKVFDRPVAVKVLSERLSESEEGRTRFRREIETAARLHHPGIVTIHDWGEHQGRDYFVMELLEGADLHGLIRSGLTWTIEQRLEVARQISDALDFAHAAGVVHRDVKPGNIMIVDRGGEPQVKLVDFGIVHVERSGLTQARSHPGTFSYMSPEQLRSEAIDRRSDLFSLGIVYYELFAGAHPFEAQSDAVISSKILRDEPEPPTKRDPEIPQELERLVLRMLEKDADQRPASAREVSDVLRGILRHVVSRSSGTDPSDFSRLDDLNRQLVENLIGWARQKEAAGLLEDARAAYDKAAHLAPDSERIRRKVEDLRHRVESSREFDASIRAARDRLAAGAVEEAREAWRRAWIVRPHDPALQSLDRELKAEEEVSPEERERRAFVEEKIRAAEAELEGGRIDAARPHLVEVLSRYPDDVEASAILDQLMQAAADGVPYGEYRAQLRRTREAIESGEFRIAREHSAKARELWGEGPDVDPLEDRIASREADAKRREEELRTERETKEREEAHRRRELLERYLESARKLLADAREARARSPVDPVAVHDAYERVDRAVDLVLTEDPGHEEALRFRGEVRAEVAGFREAEAAKAREAETAKAREAAAAKAREAEAAKAREAAAAKAREAEAAKAREAAAAKAREADAVEVKAVAPPATRPRRPARPPAAPRRKTGLWIGIGAAAVVVVGVAVTLLMRGGDAEPPPPPPPPRAAGYAAIQVFPWGRVVSVTDVGSGVALPEGAGKETPFVLELPPGTYRIELTNDAFPGAVDLEFSVVSGETTSVTGKFPAADAQSMLSEIERRAVGAKR